MSSQFQFLETETQFTAVHQKDCVPYYNHEMGSVILYNGQRQQLLTVRYQNKCLSCCECDVQFSAHHHSLGEVLSTTIVKQDKCCFICPCPTMQEEGIFAGQEQLGSLRSKYGCCKTPTGELIDSYSNPVFDFNMPQPSFSNRFGEEQIVFSQGGNVIATLDSQVESITEETKILFFKANMLKDRNYYATMNFPPHLPIQIKLCLLMKTAMRAHEIYRIANPKPSSNGGGGN